MKKGVLVARFSLKETAKAAVEISNEKLKKNELFYILCWIDGAFPYGVIKVIDVEGED